MTLQTHDIKDITIIGGGPAGLFASFYAGMRKASATVLGLKIGLLLVFAIAASGWVQYARMVRGSTLVEKNREYVQAARVIGVGPIAIMFRHVLPNVTGPVLVLATVRDRFTGREARARLSRTVRFG